MPKWILAETADLSEKEIQRAYEGEGESHIVQDSLEASDTEIELYLVDNNGKVIAVDEVCHGVFHRIRILTDLEEK